MFFSPSRICTPRLTNNGDVASATTEVQNALNYVSTQQTFYGNSVDRLNNAQTFLTQEQTQLTETESSALDVDMAKAITDLSQGVTTQQALLAAGAKISQLNLFSYLPSS